MKVYLKIYSQFYQQLFSYFIYFQSGGDLIPLLQEVDLFVVADPECEIFHHGDPHPENICAAVPEGGKGQCTVSLIYFNF